MRRNQEQLARTYLNLQLADSTAVKFYTPWLIYTEGLKTPERWTENIFDGKLCAVGKQILWNKVTELYRK